MVIDEIELEGLTEDQRDAYIALKEGRNVFLSGNAGTGKSYVLNRFIDDLEARSVPYTAMAPTGIAALNMHNGSVWEPHRGALYPRPYIPRCLRPTHHIT